MTEISNRIDRLSSSGGNPGRPLESPAVDEYRSRRLALRPLEVSDAPFVHRLVNDPDWLRFIGDRGVRSVEDAATYIENGPRAMERRTGFGMQVVSSLEGGAPLGMCGIVRREVLPGPDLGFAFLPEARGAGYAIEAAGATLAFAKRRFGVTRMLAIVTPSNGASLRLLAKLGFRDEGAHQVGTEELRLLAMTR